MYPVASYSPTPPPYFSNQNLQNQSPNHQISNNISQPIPSTTTTPIPSPSPSQSSQSSPCVVINNYYEWRCIEEQFRQSIGHIHAIGLDCEWVTAENFVYQEKRDYSAKNYYYDARLDEIRRTNAAQGRVALLQLATHDGFTVLIRLCLFQDVPPTLKQLLENERLIKLGVNIENDVKKLFTTWGILVTSFVDVRNVFGQNRRFLEEYDKDGLGLKRLGAFFVNEDSPDEKTKLIRYSNWAARRLNRDQIEYASKDARMAIESLISFAINYIDDIPESKMHPQFWSHLRSRMQNHVGRPCALYLVNYGKSEAQNDDGVVDYYEDEEGEDGSSSNNIAAVVENSNKPSPSSTSKQKSSSIADIRLDSSSSDVELDFVNWQKSKAFKSVEKQTGADRATLFYYEEEDAGGNHNQYGGRRQQRAMAAIDSAFLASMKEAGEKKAQLRFKIKDNSNGKQEDYVHELKVTLRRLDS